MIKQSNPEKLNAIGTIIGAVGCTPDCSENPITHLQSCENKGTVQVRYQLDNEAGWIVSNTTSPLICNQEPCCASQIASGQTIYLRVDDGQVKLVDTDRYAASEFLFAIGVAAIVGSSVLLFCIGGMAIAFYIKRSAYTVV